MVRCGRCANVFDGFKTLATQADDSPVESPPPAGVVPAKNGIAAGYIPPAVDTAPTGPSLESATSPSASAIVTPSQAVVIPQAPLAFDEPAFEIEPRRRRRSVMLASAISLLLFALAAQGVYVYRGDIAARFPEARPYLNALCGQFRCTIALPQRPRLISIEASDLQATDPSNPGLISLTATLRNQATTTLGYPALDVVLTNAKDHTVARRVFLPNEYLEAGKDARAGIAPNAEITVKLNIDSGDLGAVGFRLDLLATP
jgi:hypothetical protein